MAKTATVQGHGPEPKRAPRWRVVRHRPTAMVVTAIDVAEANARRSDLIATMPHGEAWRGFVDKIRETLDKPVHQGKGLRPAGLNVPLRETAKKIYYPFGKVIKRPVRETISKERVVF